MTITEERIEHGWPRRHVDVVQLVAIGMSNEEIAERLYISTHTVKRHLADMQQRYIARNRAHLVFIAMRAGVFR